MSVTQAVAVVLFAVACFAQKTWTGAGGTNLWNNAANWKPSGIPTAQDDVSIDSANVLISNFFGGIAKSLVVSGNSSLAVQGCSLNVGAGGFNLKDTASFKIDAGNGTVSVNGTGMIASTTGAQFVSGGMVGDWKVASGSALYFGAANQLNIAGSLSNQGTVTSLVSRVSVTINAFTNSAGGKATFSSGTLNLVSLINEGTINLNMQTVFITASSSGSGMVYAKASILQGIFSNVSFTDSNSVLSGICNGVDIATGETLKTQNAQLSNVVGGDVECFGDVTLGGQIGLAKLTYSGGARPGPIIITGTGGIDIISLAYNGEKYLTYSSSTPLKVGRIEQLAGDVHLSGVWTPDTMNIAGNAITIEQGTSVTVGHASFSAHVDLSGTFVVNTLLNSSSGSHWALVGSTPGKLINNGGILIAAGPSPVVFDKITYSGSGFIHVEGALDLEEATFAFTDIGLKALTARITGESVTLSYNSLTAPIAGKTIQFLADDNQWTCNSPCGGMTAKKFQSFNLWMRQ